MVSFLSQNSRIKIQRIPSIDPTKVVNKTYKQVALMGVTVSYGTIWSLKDTATGHEQKIPAKYAKSLFFQGKKMPHVSKPIGGLIAVVIVGVVAGGVYFAASKSASAVASDSGKYSKAYFQKLTQGGVDNALLKDAALHSSDSEFALLVEQTNSPSTKEYFLQYRAMYQAFPNIEDEFKQNGSELLTAVQGGSGAGKESNRLLTYFQLARDTQRKGVFNSSASSYSRNYNDVKLVLNVQGQQYIAFEYSKNY
jgi:hypothetical protein